MLRHYFLLSIKVLLRRKVFTAISLFGITATLMVFVVIAALIDHGFGPSVPETQLDRQLSVMRVNLYGDHMFMNSGGSYSLFNHHARDLPGVRHLSIFSGSNSVDAFPGGRKVSLQIKRTDGDFWKVFEFPFLEGRPYTTVDVDNAEFVAVLSTRARNLLLGDGPAEGRMIEADGQRFRVVGVVADVSEMRALPFADFWVPHTTAKGEQRGGEDILGGYQAAIVAETREALPGIRAEFDARLARLERPAGIVGIIAPFETQFEGWSRQLFNDRSASNKAPRMIALLATCGLLLALLPAVNLVNLNVSRIMERASEIGVRKAFGASSRTLVAQFVVENILLTVVGALLAMAGSWFVLRGINESGMIANAQLALNYRVFLAGVVLALLFGLLSGVYPAWRMSRLHPIVALKGQAR
jgi:putative ABC transport system permease protein